MTTPSGSLAVTSLCYPTGATPVERTAAAELAAVFGVPAVASSRAGKGFNVSLASRGWTKPKVPSKIASRGGWMWLRLADGVGEICADEPALLFAAARLLVQGLPDQARAKLERGVLLPAAFNWHRSHWDGCYTQYWRSARDFDPEQYVATLAESGFTHVEVNGLQAHMPYEDTVPFEYYPQFYTYAPGFNHFVATSLTAGYWPNQYLEANLVHLQKLAHLGRTYGLRPGVCMFEPRSMPERLFARFPTLRGARVDHPFRSRLPRYCLAQDHPVSQAHYRSAINLLQQAVPDLAYMSVWTNDSGAGFEHSASLYVGRNGGPYLIREWRSHEKVAIASGESITRFLHNLQTAAAENNPDFDVILRIEPFKVEHETIKKGMGGHVVWEAPSLLVRGYSLPYSHPRYPDQGSVAGSVFQPKMDPAEKAELTAARAGGVDPVLHYSAGPLMNHEPLLGIPFPRSLHAKMASMADTGVSRISALGGLANTNCTPYWPNPAVLRAAQFFPEVSIDEVLKTEAERYVGAAHAPALVAAWDAFEEAVSWQPTVPLFTGFGFCWQRTWDRPFVPDIEAIPADDRAYYEKHGCFQHNNPALFDLGKDVLFDLVSQEWGEKSAQRFDRNVLPRLDKLQAKLEKLIGAASIEPSVAAVFTDLKDRVRAYRCWCIALRSVCAWCGHVYGYLESKSAAAKKKHVAGLQATIDLDLASTKELIVLLEEAPTETIMLSDIGNNTFFYGEDLPDLLRKKIAVTDKYRGRKPRIPTDVLWRPMPGTIWPEFKPISV